MTILTTDSCDASHHVANTHCISGSWFRWSILGKSFLCRSQVSSLLHRSWFDTTVCQNFQNACATELSRVRDVGAHALTQSRKIVCSCFRYGINKVHQTHEADWMERS